MQTACQKQNKKQTKQKQNNQSWQHKKWPMVTEPKADLKLKANQSYVKNIIFANSVTDSSKHLPVPKTNTLNFSSFPLLQLIKYQ